MRIRHSVVTLSATDLANHLSCRHLTTLDYRLAKGELAEPSWDNPHLVVLQQRGLEHESAYIETLRSKGLGVIDLSDEPEETSIDVTRAAMEGGEQVIVQGSLAAVGWRGRADVILRVEQPSGLGEWSYEVVDCKLARETKAETILQLCLYSELVAEIQGTEPEYMHVIRPGTGFQPESYRFASFAAYHRSVKETLRQAIASGPAETYPEPVNHCDVCRWWKECDKQRRADDHLSFVAGTSKLQRKELVAQGVPTLEVLARLPLPISFKPARGSTGSYVRIREQARIQLEARLEARLKFESLRTEPGEGLARLPQPSPGDIFLDFEGDPFVGDGGLEYLTGVILLNERGELSYEGRWALNRAQEKTAFEWLIDLAFERLARFPDLHIYHYASYEPSAMKRLMLRYAIREEEVDRLLRGEVFVDLHAIIKQGVRASVEQYSLKALEKFCEYRRHTPLIDANQARHFIEHQLELSPTPELTATACKVVEGYNEDDCRATEQVRNWLETIRAEMIANGADLPRPQVKETAPSEQSSELQRRIAGLFEALTRDLPAELAGRNQEQAARWLLAHALAWHSREDKVKWWEFFRMKHLAEEALYDHKEVLTELALVGRMPKMKPKERSPIDRYRYPQQECSIKVGSKVFTFDEQSFGDVVAVDSVACTVDIKKLIKHDGAHPRSVFAHKHYSTPEQTNSILRLAEWIVANGMDVPGDYRAARDLLLRTPPRLTGGMTLVSEPDQTTVELACGLGTALDHSVLAIQGPPGAGKTFTGSHMICELVRKGRKVGITAVGHKVIRKLLDEVVKIATQLRVSGVACAHKTDADGPDGELVREIGSNEAALQGLQSGAINVLGGTPWLWSRADFMDSVHVLFVDEAGQMSLANVLACAPAGKSLVLVGDPQQLEQPQKGSHPEGSDISALAHLLDGGKTIQNDRGLFLEETWRLHPTICRFTSEMFYEGRLASLAGLERQRIDAAAPFAGAGLWYVPVAHEGNQSYSPEEVDLISSLVTLLTFEGNSWTDRHGNPQSLTRDDILCVAPFNDQVNRLRDGLPGVQVGTVDKFQGQQAAVVIYSLTTSSPQDAPRGMEFLYNLNRFNVATSRARCACIVVGSPQLLAPECRTPRQMELANILCRYREMSEHVSTGAAGAGG